MGSNIASERIRKGLTQAELAVEVDVSEGTVKRWERGKSTPNGDALLRMSDLFHCSTDYLLGRTEERVGR